MWESACFQLSRPTQHERQVPTLTPSLRALQMNSRGKNHGCAGVQVCVNYRQLGHHSEPQEADWFTPAP